MRSFCLYDSQLPNLNIFTKKRMRWEELRMYMYSYFLDVHKIWPRLSHELIRNIKIINYFVGPCIIPSWFFTMTRKTYQTVYTQIYWYLDTNSIFNSECILFEVMVIVLKMWSIFYITFDKIQHLSNLPHMGIQRWGDMVSSFHEVMNN